MMLRATVGLLCLGLLGTAARAAEVAGSGSGSAVRSQLSGECDRMLRFLARQQLKSKKKPSKQNFFQAYRACGADEKEGARLYAAALSVERRRVRDEQLERNLSELSKESANAKGVTYDLKKKEAQGDEVIRRQKAEEDSRLIEEGAPK